MKKFITATIAAAALVGATLAMSGEASAKPGNGNQHHWHHGGFGLYLAGDDYDPGCYMVKKYSPSGRPYFVEVCG